MIRNIPLWVQVSVLFLVMILLRLAQIDREPHTDELYHLLAAHSWATEGTLRIAEGAYTRTSLYTIMLGWLFRFFEDSLDRKSTRLNSSHYCASRMQYPARQKKITNYNHKSNT